jgi:peptidoglycan hydrolase CwlO-like protein
MKEFLKQFFRRGDKMSLTPSEVISQIENQIKDDENKIQEIKNKILELGRQLTPQSKQEIERLQEEIQRLRYRIFFAENKKSMILPKHNKEENLI